jgi:hypothetical protein
MGVIMIDDLKARVLEMFQGKSCRDKKMFYVRDVTRWFPDEDRHAIQDVIKKLIDEEALRYWSSGSTTYVMLAEFFPKEEGACSQ